MTRLDSISRNIAARMVRFSHRNFECLDHPAGNISKTVRAGTTPTTPTPSETRTSDPLNNAPSLGTTSLNLETLTRLAAHILKTQSELTNGSIPTETINRKCNVSEWEKRLYGRRKDLESEADLQTLPAQPLATSGLIYATFKDSSASPPFKDNKNNQGTSSGAGSDVASQKLETNPEENQERFTSFLFAVHKTSTPDLERRLKTDLLPPPKDALEDPDSPTSIPSRVQSLIQSKGITHIWLAGTDPAFERRGLMSLNLARLEEDVKAWKAGGEGGGILTAHAYPRKFPSWVQFLIKHQFKGGDVIASAEDKVFYWKEL